MAPHSYFTAIDLANRMTDAEIIEFHREVSRLARAAYGRQPRYQENYKNSLPRARAAMAEARTRTLQKHSADTGARLTP